MQNPESVNDRSAELLDALATWIVGEAAEFPILTTFLEKRYAAATAAARSKALDTYRTTGSFDSSFEAGRRAFKRDLVGSHFNHPSPLSLDSDRVVSELQLETSGDDEPAVPPRSERGRVS